MKQWEFIFHASELGVLVFGVAAPIVWSAFRLRSLLKDFPPHRHLNGKILYPKGYAPGEIEEQRSGFRS